MCAELFVFFFQLILFGSGFVVAEEVKFFSFLLLIAYLLVEQQQRKNI